MARSSPNAGNLASIQLPDWVSHFGRRTHHCGSWRLPLCTVAMLSQSDYQACQYSNTSALPKIHHLPLLNEHKPTLFAVRGCKTHRHLGKTLSTILYTVIRSSVAAGMAPCICLLKSTPWCLKDSRNHWRECRGYQKYTCSWGAQINIQWHLKRCRPKSKVVKSSNYKFTGAVFVSGRQWYCTLHGGGGGIVMWHENNLPNDRL